MLGLKHELTFAKEVLCLAAYNMNMCRQIQDAIPSQALLNLQVSYETRANPKVCIQEVVVAEPQSAV